MYWVLATQLVLVPVVRSLATYIVAVGRDGLVFSPSEIVAQVDDLIQYQFYPGNFSKSTSTRNTAVAQISRCRTKLV